MALSLHEITEASDPPRPRMSVLAAVSLVVALSGFVNVIGFLVGPAPAHIALVRLSFGRRRGENTRGRGLAIAALWVSYLILISGALTLLAILVLAYAALPSLPLLLTCIAGCSAESET